MQCSSQCVSRVLGTMACSLCIIGFSEITAESKSRHFDSPDFSCLIIAVEIESKQVLRVVKRFLVAALRLKSK